MNFTGLSLDQAPPLQAPVRFFITAPMFGMLAALMILFVDPALFESRYSMESIAVTHLFTIGLFAMVMLGALQQMLPVLAGVSLPKAGSVAVVSHAALTIGVLFMVPSLLWSEPLLAAVASAALGIGFFTILAAIAVAMTKISFFTPTVKAMITAVVFGFFIVVMGLYLLGGYASGSIGEMHGIFLDIHSVWAIFGFAGILIIGVAFQVLPMFYVTPPFRRFYNNVVIPLIISGLIAWMFSQMMLKEYEITGKFIITLFFTAFAAAVIKKMVERRRPVSDITVWYWRSSATFLGLGMFLWLFDMWLQGDHIMIVSVLIGGGFILSVITGMLYKIVPFLVWFHLNASGYMTIPTMREMLNERMAWTQFGLHMAGIFFMMAAFWFPFLAKAAGLALFVSMLLLEINLFKVLKIYRETKKREPDFVMDAAGV